VNVIAGIDGSEESIAAVQFACRILSCIEDSLAMYFSPPELRIPRNSRVDMATLSQGREALGDVVLTQAVERLPKSFRSATKTIVGDNKPAFGLLAAADQEKADLIVLGAHGMSGRMAVGSVVRKVVHGAKCPVLVGRTSDDELEREKLTVLMAYADSPACEAAVKTINEIVWPAEIDGGVVNVVDSPAASYMSDDMATEQFPDYQRFADEYERIIAREKERVIDRLSEVQRQLPSSFQQRPPIIRSGHVVKQLVETVESEKVDLLVVGARNLGPIGRLLGSTTEGLLARCPCSLLIAHPSEKL
jgi:nucleotide-binding universal stress UspA family protein